MSDVAAPVVETKPTTDRAQKPAAEPTTIAPEDFRKPSAIAKPAEADDLKLISGVGPRIEGVLHSLGIYTFAQIAEWQAPEIAWVDDYLNFRGRVARDNWIAQAGALADGGLEEYQRRFGKSPR
ncbi:MAG: hypothetical protein HC779_02895 [Phyllobacteriaceae bacterium]|nr:hypothetical protein [Phyllobacteriaceae bacterium]